MSKPDTETKWIIDPAKLSEMGNKGLIDEFAKVVAKVGENYLKCGYKGLDIAILDRMNPEFNNIHPRCIVCQEFIEQGEVFHQGLLHKDCVKNSEKPESDESEIKQLQNEIKELRKDIFNLLNGCGLEKISNIRIYGFKTEEVYDALKYAKEKGWQPKEGS